MLRRPFCELIYGTRLLVLTIQGRLSHYDFLRLLSKFLTNHRLLVFFKFLICPQFLLASLKYQSNGIRVFPGNVDLHIYCLYFGLKILLFIHYINNCIEKEYLLHLHQNGYLVHSDQKLDWDIPIIDNERNQPLKSFPVTITEQKKEIVCLQLMLYLVKTP